MFIEILRLVWFGKVSPNKSELVEVAYSDLLHVPTFRFPRTEKNIIKAYLSALLSTIQKIWSSDDQHLNVTLNSIIILDSFNNRWNPENRIKYVQSIYESPSGYSLLNKSSLTTKFDFFERLFWTVCVAITQPLIMIIFTLKGGIHQNGVILSSVFLENKMLCRLMRNNQCKSIVYFNSYEFDSNFAYLNLRKRGFKCTKIPSPNPLSYHYKFIFTDTLILTSKYQMEEINERMIHTSGEIVFWAPENSPLYLGRYLEESPKRSNRIGFYSSANWLRYKLGRVELESRVKMDADILLELGKFCNENNLEFVVFLHPREKIHANLEEVQAYYRNHLDSLEFKFYSYAMDEISACHLDYVDLAVSPITTLFFERIFCGFKTIMVINEKDVFPHANSALNNICLAEVTLLAAKLKVSFEQSNELFFKQNGLSDYVLNGISQDSFKMKFCHEL